eukprot:145688-Pleurochrysis_carterae.AAC.3
MADLDPEVVVQDEALDVVGAAVSLLVDVGRVVVVIVVTLLPALLVLLADEVIILLADHDLAQVALETHESPKLTIVPSKPSLLGTVEPQAPLLVLECNLAQLSARPASPSPKEAKNESRLRCKDTNVCWNHRWEDGIKKW